MTCRRSLDNSGFVTFRLLSRDAPRKLLCNAETARVWSCDYEIARFKLLFSIYTCDEKLRSVTIGRYQVSVILLLIVAVVLGPVAIAATYLWASRTMSFSVDEPLSITDCPTTIHVHPGENKTLDITIVNSATANYSVTLFFALNDTAYDESYVTFSNYTYNISPRTNYIEAWIFVDKKAPPALLELQIAFHRK